MQILSHHLRDTPPRLSNLRAPGKIANVFAVEIFADELARGTGMDPLAFRRRGMSDARVLDVLDRTASMMDWQARPSPNPKAAEGGWLAGRGIAYMRYKQAENYVGIGITAAVNRKSGAIQVRRIVCTHDCGRFPEAPVVQVSLIDRPKEPAYGAGEAASAPVAAALGNAIFDATGVRLRTVPFTSSRVKAEMARA